MEMHEYADNTGKPVRFLRNDIYIQAYPGIHWTESVAHYWSEVVRLRVLFQRSKASGKYSVETGTT